MTTELKIVANRRNAKKSSGPRSPGGKRVSRLNALRHGVFAESPLIPGEDPDQYAALLAAAFAQLAPDGVFEQMFLWQAVRDVWRVRRLDLAERTYLEQTREAVFRRAAKLHSRDAGAPMAVKHAASACDSSRPGREATHATSLAPQQIPQNSEVLGLILLEANVSAGEPFPLAELDRRRRMLMRDISRKLAAARGVQESLVRSGPE